MDDDRYYDRGTFRYVARPSAYPHQQQNGGGYNSQYTHSSSRAYPNSHSYREEARYPPPPQQGYTSTHPLARRPLSPNPSPQHPVIRL